MNPLDQSVLFEKPLYRVVDVAVEMLEAELNKLAEQGYYPASAPQLYIQTLDDLETKFPYVVVILELDEDRLKLEGRRA